MNRGESFDKLVREERERQDRRTPTGNGLDFWWLVLSKEAGEVADAILCLRAVRARASPLRNGLTIEEAGIDLLNELVQVAAVAKAIVEQDPTFAFMDQPGT